MEEEKTLKELFAEASQIGDKYQTEEEKAAFEAAIAKEKAEFAALLAELNIEEEE